MSILAWTADGFHTSPADARSRGLFGRAMDAIVEARTAKVMPVVVEALKKLSDEQLRDLGHSQEEIARLRKLPNVAPNYFI